jgi:hypothetical protein
MRITVALLAAVLCLSVCALHPRHPHRCPVIATQWPAAARCPDWREVQLR